MYLGKKRDPAEMASGPLVLCFINRMLVNQGKAQVLRLLKSPFEKGGFRGIFRGLYKIPYSPFPKGG
jgi:hypothetical protein